MIVTIHQPDMLPWLGLFNKINKADIWVILDHTQNNPRDAAFWGRRVKILVNGEGKWLSLPIKKPDIPGTIGIPINEMFFNESDPKIFTSALRSIEINYNKSLYFKEVFPFVESFFLSTEMNLAKRNLSFIFNVMEMLEINTKIHYSSHLSCEKKSTELLIEILNKTGGSTYLCGGGASGYQKDELFFNAGISVIYNNFQHPTYHQIGTKQFIPGLSIIDALMHCGITNTRKLISN